MEHTPGPWKVVDRVRVWTDDSVGCEVASVCEENLDEDMIGQAEADARLIAAAPDLLAALRAVNAELIELYERAYPDDETDNDTTAAIDMAIAAIAKAEGE